MTKTDDHETGTRDIAGADAVRDALNHVLEADRKPDGRLCQNNTFRFIIATKR